MPMVRSSGAELLTVPEGRVCTEMLDLYQVDGIVAEPAGAMASAALGDEVTVEPGSTVVCLLSGGNNDVSRYAEVVERSLVHRGLKHYFLVEFPQEPGALRRFLDEVLGPDDDIVLFEYVKRDNRETGAALVGDRDQQPGGLRAAVGADEGQPAEDPARGAGEHGVPVPDLTSPRLFRRAPACRTPPGDGVRVRHTQNILPASRAAAWAARRPVSASAVARSGRNSMPVMSAMPAQRSQSSKKGRWKSAPKAGPRPGP